MRELSLNEVQSVAGGDIDWSMVGAAVAIVGLGVAIAATGGLAGIGVGIIAGAGTVGEIGVAATAVALAGAGGVVAGSSGGG